MQNLNILLPEPLKEFVDGQIAAGRYRSASEYVGDLIREDEKRKASAMIESLLLEGVASEETELTREDWTDIRKESRSQAQTKKNGR